MVNHPNRRKRLKSADLEAIATANKMPAKTVAAIAESLGFNVEKFYIWKEEDGDRSQVVATSFVTRKEAENVAAKMTSTQHRLFFVTTRGKPSKTAGYVAVPAGALD
jgi:hypothetical protein